MNNELDKYPAHEKLARDASFLAPSILPGGFVGIINEYTAFLHRQQEQKKLIASYEAKLGAMQVNADVDRELIKDLASQLYDLELCFDKELSTSGYVRTRMLIEKANARLSGGV